MSTHLDRNVRLGRLSLLLGAAALALAGVLAPVHLALAHHCDTHHSTTDECFVCLHWQHHAVGQVAIWSAPADWTLVGLVATRTPNTRDQHRPVPCSRAPPASQTVS